MKLYYFPQACSMASHIVLEWIGKPYEIQEVTKEKLKTPEYLKLNPAGAVPTLTEGDWALTQNIAILEYLAEQAPAAGLMGDGSARSRAEVRRWLGFLNSDVHATFSLVFHPQRYLEEEAAQNALRAGAMAMLNKYFSILDRHLAEHPYLVGDTPSIADAYLYVMLRWGRHSGIGQDGNLAAFFERMHANPGVQAALKAEGLK
jgi:glutathione S-transferase